MFGWLAGFPKATGGPDNGRPTPTEDTVIIGSDDLGMASVIVVSLEHEVLDLNANPNSVEWKSDTDALPLPTMAALEANVAIKEISALLQEIPSVQPRGSATPQQGISPKFRMPLNTGIPMEHPAPVCLLDLPNPFFQVKLPTWYPARCRQQLCALPMTMMSMMRLQPLVYCRVGNGKATYSGTVLCTVATVGH